ncbi:gliding motility protein GldN [Flavobacteriaceae bacterium]|nr:gliding motility protein GldN [Flavobacteriaceae bacterium]
MIRKYFLTVVILLFTTSYLCAQVNMLNATEVDQIGKQTKEKIAADNDIPLSYGYIDDRDILWSKVVWEFVDLNQKINLPYYYPIDTANISNDRRSLFDTLLKGIRTGSIKNVYSDSFFTSKMSTQDIDEVLSDNRIQGDDTIPYVISTQDIEGYMIKGIWYFDKRLGELKYRLLALSPMGKDIQALGTDSDDGEIFELFWIFYPETRNILHKAKVFNPKNISQPISYDHLLNARRFSSVIVREANIYGNREIADYIRGNSLFQLLEADRIKESIRNKEIDMWNY